MLLGCFLNVLSGSMDCIRGSELGFVQRGEKKKELTEKTKKKNKKSLKLLFYLSSGINDANMNKNG